MIACRGLISNIYRLSTAPTGILARKNIYPGASNNIHTTPILWAEPLKKKKKLDPAVVRAREERKRKKIEKQIRRLEKNARQLKPLEECEIPLNIIDERDIRTRSNPPLPEEELERRALLEKSWSKYKQNHHLRDIKMLDRILFSQQKALDELRAESEELYQEAIQTDFHLIPFKSEGPVQTPPIDNYDVPDGDYLDVSRKWD
ncbi:39S ribosomal protein L40, mitochondrial [Coccinella septempunctata]|uniref:39S ribosomal protein L40, mitochondrial n=1 Tax=Coccinella septempunctata TaxID=41139 RepID=UPI001D079DBF|nr:39S ribosomal protein L40, mitochondrial [Coccinella septempunctata]